MARRIKLGFTASGGSNNSAVSSKQSKGANTNSFTQATTSKKPTSKSLGNAHSTLSEETTSVSCDGGDVISLASTETLAANSTYTIICAWTNGDYTNDTWLVSGTSNDAHWGIKAGGAAVIYKADGTKGAAAERDYAINSTANSTTSYTFGSDVEMLAIVVDGTGILEANIYNIDGNKIADVAAVNSNGVTVALPIDHALGKSDGTLGLNGEILDICVYNELLSVSAITGKGKKYKSCKD
tara:strand:+ start:660 stop:1379 length:720 start_codon:yes stop_codon:yes gene_type:complete